MTTVATAVADKPLTRREKVKRRSEITEMRALRLEIKTAVARSVDPAGKKPLAPFGDAPAWAPQVWRRDDGKKPRDKDAVKTAKRRKAKKDDGGMWQLRAAETPTVIFKRIVEIQLRRLHEATAASFRALWLNLNGEQTPPPEGKKFNLATYSYQALRDILRDQDLPKEMQGCGMPSELIRERSNRVMSEITTWRKKLKSNPFAMYPQNHHAWPLYFGAGGWRICRADGLNLRVNLDGTWWELGLAVPRKKGRKQADGYVYGILKRVVAGEHMRAFTGELPTEAEWHGAGLEITKERDKFYAKIIYRRTKPEKRIVDNSMVVHCGLRNLLVAYDRRALLKGRRGFWIEGAPLHDARRIFNARRQRIQRSAQLRRAGRGYGHVRGKKLALQFKQDQWTEAFLRRIAARVVRQAFAQGCNTIWVADYTDIRKRAEGARSDLPNGVRIAVHSAPWFKLRTFIEQGAVLKGITVQTYTPRYHTKRCPGCMHVATDDDILVGNGPNYKKWTYSCGECGWHANIDRIAIENAALDLHLVQPGEMPFEAHRNREHEDQREVAKFFGMDKPPKK